MEREQKAKPPRLPSVFQDYAAPVFFVTFCTRDRRTLLANRLVHEAFSEYAERGAAEFDVAVGRYVIMPDHIHLFVCGGANFDLGLWVRGLKRALSSAIPGMADGVKIWQPGFFDHLLRNSDSYADKWAYVLENPVRAGLVRTAGEWPYQGRIAVIDRV